MKQAIVVREDLKLSTGKLATQTAHASISAYKKSSFINKKIWELEGQKKVILKIENEKGLMGIYNKAKDGKLPVSLIRDAGKTEIPAGTITCVGIGPANDKKIDKITSSLKLL